MRKTTGSIIKGPLAKFNIPYFSPGSADYGADFDLTRMAVGALAVW